MRHLDQYNNKIGGIVQQMDRLLSNKKHGNNKKDSYLQIFRYKRIQWNETLMEQSAQFVNFCQIKAKRVLFVCGPSGCGKTELVTKMLEGNGIQYQWALPQVREQENEMIYSQGIIEMITRYFQSSVQWEEQIILFNDFPIVTDEMPKQIASKIRQFKSNIYNIISRLNFNKNKYIFILNSQIYNPFYILNQGSPQKCLSLLSNVSVIKMKPYGNKKMKIIIQNFKNNHSQYFNTLNNPIAIDEIITQACGDARKAMNLIYLRKLSEKAKDIKMQIQLPVYKVKLFDQFNKTHEKSKIKTFGTFFKFQPKPQQNQQSLKIGIYNALGKFLYAKRYNIDFNPNKKQTKIGNPKSRHYTKQELLKYNPKFYFKPLQLFEKSHISFHIFTELLAQNFLNRYGCIKDVSKMYDIFRICDDTYASYNQYQSYVEMEQQKQYLITWGIILYNQNCDNSNKNFLIQRSKSLILTKTLSQKIQLLKQYYIHYKEEHYETKYKLSDIIRYAYLIKDRWNRYKHRNMTFYEQLINIVFNNEKRNTLFGQVNDDTMTIREQDDEMAVNQTYKLNKIQERLTKQINDRIKEQKKIQSIIDQQSDIDSD